jgi:hypothetical protein
VHLVVLDISPFYVNFMSFYTHSDEGLSYKQNKVVTTDEQDFTFL